MNFWNEIYSHFSPIAFSAFGFNIHWYSLAYVSALLIGFFLAKYFVKTMPRFSHIDSKIIDSYFIWVEIGISAWGAFWLSFYLYRFCYVLSHTPLGSFSTPMLMGDL